MGSYIEINDTLQITTEQGFPFELLNLEKHRQSPISFEEVKDKIFEFRDKSNARVFHSPPTRCFLVHNIDGKWLYWGHCYIIEQTINGETKKTSGKFIITKLYSPEHQKQMSIHEVPEGCEFLK